MKTMLMSAVFSLTGCIAEYSADIWFEDSLTKIFPDYYPLLIPTETPVLYAARNSHASIQLLIRPKSKISGLKILLTEPALDSQSLSSQIRHVGLVPVTSNTPKSPSEEIIRKAPDNFPDPLYKELPKELEAGKTESFWITIYVPAETKPGNYTGEAQIIIDDKKIKTLRFNIEVVKATVPDRQRLKITNWLRLYRSYIEEFYDFQDDEDRYWEIVENIADVMGDYKQNVILTPIDLLVQVSHDGNAFVFDFSDLERWVNIFKKSGVIGLIEGRSLLRRPNGYYDNVIVSTYVYENSEITQQNLDPFDPRAEEYLGSFLAGLRSFLENRDLEDIYLQHVLDEPHNETEVEIYKKYSDFYRDHLPNVKIIEAIYFNSFIDALGDYIDIWVPKLGTFDDNLDILQIHSNSGGQNWFYTSLTPQGKYLNRFIDFSLLKVRFLHWLNYKMGLEGYLHWGANYWDGDPFTNVQPVINDGTTLLPPGDSAILYPDVKNNSVFTSIRLEMMREGIEDYELLSELGVKKPDLSDGLASQAISDFINYIRDEKTFREIHKDLLNKASE